MGPHVDHLAPEMRTQDPMRYQANPNTMWSRMGPYRENVSGNHQAVVPDGQLCGGGRTQNGLYASLDAVGAWIAARKPAKFTLNPQDEARHGAVQVDATGFTGRHVTYTIRQASHLDQPYYICSDVILE